MKVKLSDITKYSKGEQINGDDLIDDGKYIYLNGGIKPSGRWSSSNVPGNTVTISEGGNSSGYVNYISEPFWCGAHCYYLYDGPRNSKYLYYALKSQQDRLFAIRSGACMPNIKKNDLGKFELEFDFNEQKQKEIVNVLSYVEQVISNRQKELDLLDDLIKARFVELFGDVICNEKRWPAYALADISESRLGKMLDAKQQTGEHQHPYLANFNVQWFRFDFSQLNEMDFNEADRKEFELQDGDLLVTEGGEVGRCAVWKNEIPSCYFQKALHRVRCDKQIVLPEYLAWWFKQHADYNSFEDVVGGKTSIPHLTGVKLKNLMVVVPDMALQRQFVDFSKQVNKSKVAVKKALDEAQLLFDSLMQKYFG